MKSFDFNDIRDSNCCHHFCIAIEFHTIPLVFADWFFYRYKIGLNDCFYQKRCYAANNGLNEAHAKVFDNGDSNDAQLLQRILFWMDLQSNDDVVCGSYDVGFFHLLFVIYLHNYYFFSIDHIFNIMLLLF